MAQDYLNKSIEALDEAIQLHEAHMDGTEPTSDKSQKKLMKLIENAYNNLEKVKGDDGSMAAHKSVAKKGGGNGAMKCPMNKCPGPKSMPMKKMGKGMMK